MREEVFREPLLSTFLLILKVMKHFLVFFAVIVSANITFAQAPQWKSGFFKELENTYIEMASGTAKTIDAARDKAASEIVRKRDMTTGASVKVVNGQVTTSGSLTVKSRIIDEYVERNSQGDYTVYILAQTAKHPSNPYEQVNVTDEYPFSARCLVPGMQQFYKGQAAKGIVFIAAEVASIGGIVVTESMRGDYSSKAAIETTGKRKVEYIDNANTMQTARNICIGAAAVAYIWNVVDAVVTKGGKRVVLLDLALLPYASDDSFGLALSYHF